MKLLLIHALGIIIIQITFTQTRPRPLVGNLKNSAVAEGCGCYFQFRSTPDSAERYILFSSIENDGNETAWMNIDGRDVKLKLQKKSGPFWIQQRERPGKRSTVKYVVENITVNGTYITTKVCPRNDESCESTEYNVTLVVKKGARSQVVKAKGSCGC